MPSADLQAGDQPAALLHTVDVGEPPALLVDKLLQLIARDAVVKVLRVDQRVPGVVHHPDPAAKGGSVAAADAVRDDLARPHDDRVGADLLLADELLHRELLLPFLFQLYLVLVFLESSYGG